MLETFLNVVTELLVCLNIFPIGTTKDVIPLTLSINKSITWFYKLASEVGITFICSTLPQAFIWDECCIMICKTYTKYTFRYPLVLDSIFTLIKTNYSAKYAWIWVFSDTYKRKIWDSVLRREKTVKQNPYSGVFYAENLLAKNIK